MSNVAKLKKKAAELEERRQYDKALALYEQVLDQMENSAEDADVSLFNRVGDLTLRQGRVTQAVSYYERAVDLYTDGGFLNNAIALCNKILRNAPGRTSVYYKLGKISARKGFTTDAKHNFLEFADRMQKGGMWEEAFSALEEFANLCPDQDDVRLMLAEQLTRRNKGTEALVQLQILYGKYRAEDRMTEANATLERMRALDPDVVPQESQQAAPEKSSDLIFLQVSYDEPGPAGNAPQLNAGPSGRDPRLSGAVPITHPADVLGTPLSTSNSGDFIRSGEEFGRTTTSELDSVSRAAMERESPESGMLHDLALAGILPSLDTPGMPAPEQVMLVADDEVEDADAIAVLDLDYGSLVTEYGPTGADTSQFPDAGGLAGLDILDIERTSETSVELESRISETDLQIVHGSAPNAGGDGGSAALLDAPPASLNASEGLIELTTALSHDSLKSIAQSEAELQSLLRVEPNDFALVRRLGEVLIEDGRRPEGLAELERAMGGFETAGAIVDALSVAEEILRLEPNSVKHHQKRVEYAYRNNDQTLLIDAYLELADALFRTSQLTKASVVYERVLELSPDNSRASYAVAALLAGSKDEGAPGNSKPATQGPPGPAVASSTAEASAGGDAAADFVNLADLLSEDDQPRTTRMIVEDEAPSGNEEADFAEMLEKFKRGLAENVDAEDYESHYDLGVAFREMGLLDEAIAQFQRALRGTLRRVRTLEALGQCFVERSQFQVARNVLLRALNEGDESDENLVGVLYLLGYASEALHQYSESLEYYQRVFMVDIQFRDVTTRIATLEKMAS